MHIQCEKMHVFLCKKKPTLADKNLQMCDRISKERETLQ